MTKTSRSGYEITIKAFFPADPRDPNTIDGALHRIGALGASMESYGLDWSMTGPRWIARRKITTPPQPVGAADPALPGPPTAPQEQAGEGASSPPSPADDMPSFLRRT